MTPTSHVEINVNTSHWLAMEFAQLKTRGQNIVEMKLAFSRELGMQKITESAETGAFTSLNSAKSIQIHALQCTILVGRMSMDDVLMTIRVIAILNVATDVFGTVPGRFTITYPVEMIAYTGSLV